MKELEELGLNKNEITIYIQALRTRTATAKRIASLANLPRSTTYDVLESLKEKGLVSTFTKEKKQYFQANKPQVLLEQLKEKESIATRIIPELEQLQGTIIERPKLQLFEGTSGVFAVLDEIVAERKELLIIGNRDRADNILRHIPQQFAIKRLENKIHMRGVFERSKIAESLNKGKLGKITKVRFSKLMQKVNTVTLIYGNIVVTLTLEPNPIGVKITSKAIADTYKLIFEELWRNAQT